MNNEINRGELARQVFENPIYQEAITANKARLFDMWASTKWFQVRKREAIWRMYRDAEVNQNYIEKCITTGNMARKVQDDQNRLKSVR